MAKQAAPVAVVEDGKRSFLISRGDSEPVEIRAASVEDAIRAFNGDKSSYSKKQLTIVDSGAKSPEPV